eukprot:816783-Rhodomonas_salina.1
MSPTTSDAGSTAPIPTAACTLPLQSAATAGTSCPSSVAPPIIICGCGGTRGTPPLPLRASLLLPPCAANPAGPGSGPGPSTPALPPAGPACACACGGAAGAAGAGAANAPIACLSPDPSPTPLCPPCCISACPGARLAEISLEISRIPA